MPMDDFEQDGLAIAEVDDETKARRPSLYNVLIHNDDFTSMEFVVFILLTVFGRSEDEAIELMLKVHQEGVGIVGLYTYEVAEMKVAKVTSLDQANEIHMHSTTAHGAGGGES